MKTEHFQNEHNITKTLDAFDQPAPKMATVWIKVTGNTGTPMPYIFRNNSPLKDNLTSEPGIEPAIP